MSGGGGVELFGTAFQNPVLLAAGTCGFGLEVGSVIDLEALGGIVTKSVTLEPRAGNPAPRVAEFGAGMLNSIGLANPGVEVVRIEKLPWLERNLRRARVLLSLAGHTESDYPELVGRLDEGPGFLGFELNLSCPNDASRAGLPFALDSEALPRVVEACRARTDRPLLVKLAPNDPTAGRSARLAVSAGADALTLTNTLPGRLLDPSSGQPEIGAGQGGVSGPALRPVALQALAAVRAEVEVPLVGVGGIGTISDARQYFHAGAALVQVGTAALADPRAPARIARAWLDDPAPIRR